MSEGSGMDARVLAASLRTIALEPGAAPGRPARERAETLAAAIDRFMTAPTSAAALAQRIAESLPDGPIDPSWARVLAPVLTGIAAPAHWGLLREEFRVTALGDARGKLDAAGGGPDGASSPSAPVLPILVAARDEAGALTRTLRSMVRAILHFRSRRPEIEVRLHLCDNASRDATPRILAELRREIEPQGIPVQLYSEPEPGKERALKRMLAEVTGLAEADATDAAEDGAPLEGAGENGVRKGGAPGRVVFADADVDWLPSTLTSLWETLDQRTEIDFVGARIVPRRESLRGGNVWGVLDSVPFLGFGGSGANGHGRHFRFVSGMTYMGRLDVARAIHDRIPLAIENEDVALSFLARPERIAIARDAVVEYRIAQSRREFLAIKSRHVRGCMQILEWAAALATARALAAELERRGCGALVPGVWTGRVGDLVRKARRDEGRTVRRVVEMGTIPMARSVVLERHETPVQRRDGSIDIRRRVAVFASPTHLLAISTLMLPYYTAFKVAARRQLRIPPDLEGWTPVRDAALPLPPDHGHELGLD
jgi:hypothetical protein